MTENKLTLRLRTRDNLMELLAAGKSGEWKVGKNKENEISKVQIFNWDRTLMLEASLDISNTSRREDNRLIVGLGADAKIIKCNPPLEWNGQNPVKYFNEYSQEESEETESDLASESIIAVIRDFLPPDNHVYNCINNFIQATGIRGTLYGLKVRPQDDSFFGKYIRTSGGIKELIEKDAGLSTDSQMLLRDNARILKEELISRCPENISMELWVVYLLENILEKCYLVTVTTSDFDTAYRIFSTINTRGLDLQLNDVLKAEIIGKIEDDENKEKYTKIWDGEESDLGRKDFEILFSHIHRIKTRKRAQESLLTEYRKYIKPQDNPTQFIDEVLKPCSDMFEILIHQRFYCENKNDEQEINRLFAWLNRIDNSNWLPPAIYFLVKHYHQTEQIKAFFSQLERLAAGLMILRADINQRARKYAHILNSIDERAEQAIITTKELLSPEEQKAIIEIINGDIYLQNRSRIYILTRLDSAIADGGLSPSFDSKMLTIEHVLPQNPKPDSDWCKNWENEIREKWVHRLGNLVLLPKKKNSQAQNLDFPQKKTKYFKSDSVTIFPLTINVINQENWTEDIVINYQKIYVDKLKNIWNLSLDNQIIDKKQEAIITDTNKNANIDNLLTDLEIKFKNSKPL